jgi:glycine/D-amino acid oxidase-like deaminating enzyme
MASTMTSSNTNGIIDVTANVDVVTGQVQWEFRSIDPDTGDRTAVETVPAVRAYLTRRFPALHDAPLVGAEVCQYENTCNGDFLIDRHPALENVWLVGGGSGHGFKHGPVVGEYVARLVTEGGVSDERFQLATKARFQQRTVY